MNLDNLTRLMSILDKEELKKRLKALCFEIKHIIWAVLSPCCRVERVINYSTQKNFLKKASLIGL